MWIYFLLYEVGIMCIEYNCFKIHFVSKKTLVKKFKMIFLLKFTLKLRIKSKCILMALLVFLLLLLFCTEVFKTVLNEIKYVAMTLINIC